MALTVNVETNVKEELQAAVSVCVRNVMVLLVSVGTSASVLMDAANVLNAVSSVAIMSACSGVARGGALGA